MAEYICDTARRLHLKKPPAVWPDALPERLYLPDLLREYVTGGWDGQRWVPAQRWEEQGEPPPMIYPLVGLFDNPADQAQELLLADTSRGSGHLLVFGSAGSGKSVLLRTMVTSLAMTNSPANVQLYIIDYGGQSALKILETFPHVGAVASRLEAERSERLVHHVCSEVARRNRLLREAHVDNWIDYNDQAKPADRLPALYLVIDGFQDFKRAFESDFINQVSQLVSGGGAAGLYLIISAGLQNDLPMDLFANISLRISLNQASPTEYFSLVGQPSEPKLEEDAAKGLRPGRGLLRATPPLEFQAALPSVGKDDRQLVVSLGELAAKMRAAWQGPLPSEIHALPLQLTLPQWPRLAAASSEPYYVPVGKDFEELNWVGQTLERDGPAFLVAGATHKSGVTTLLQTWLLSLAERFPPEDLELVLIDFHKRSLDNLRGLPHLRDYVRTRGGVQPALDSLVNTIQERRNAVEKADQADPDNFDRQAFARRFPQIVVVIDDYDSFHLEVADEFGNSEEKKQLADCLTQGGQLGTSYIIAGAIAELPKDFEDPFIKRFRRGGAGFLLGGVEGIEEFNNAKRPSGMPGAGLPPGRGFLVRRGQGHLIQVAVPWEGNDKPEAALARRIQALSGKKLTKSS